MTHAIDTSFGAPDLHEEFPDLGALGRSAPPDYACARVSPGTCEKSQFGKIAILALDLGTKTGFALRKRDGKVIHGTHVFTPRASWSPGQKWSRFRLWLSSTITEHCITVIAFEDVKRHGPGQVLAAHAYGGFRAMLEMVADQHNVTLQAVGVGTIKKSWTGAGNADKPMMIAEAKRRGFMVEDDNNADALAILHWAAKAEREADAPVVKRPKKAKEVA